MARALWIANPENATIEALKQVSRLGSIETATRCTAIQMLLAGANRDLFCNARLATNRALRKWINRFNRCGDHGPIVKKRPGRMSIIDVSCKEYKIERIWLTMKARWFNNDVCKNEQQLIERLDPAILDVIYNSKKTQKTACTGTLL
jgi:hypothetical protein